MAEGAAHPVGIDQFAQGLAAIPDLKPDAVLSYLQAHPVQPDSLQPYLFFSPASYTRNLIFKNDLFELIAICWEVGQVSRIHNHRNQLCWMAVPIGKLKTQNYRVENRNPAQGSCRLVPTESFLLTPAEPAQVDQEEPVHQVLNLAEYKQRAVSLHIYSRPFNTCEIYQIDRGTYCDVELEYTSEYGRLCDGQTTAARP